MLYTLVLAIEYKKYKKPATVALSINGNLIEQFTLDTDQGTTNTMLSMVEKTLYKDIDRLRWIEREDWKEYWASRPKFFKVFTIAEENLTGDLEIKVENADSDFTNGFMKNNSNLKFPIIALFPSALVKNGGGNLMKIFAKFDDAYDKHIKRKGIQLSKTAPMSADEKKWRANRIVGRWPCVESFYAHREHELFEKSEIRDSVWWIGGSFTAKIPIRTKHKIKYLGCPRGKEYGFFDLCNINSFTIASVKQLINIYNEDQRSNSTKD